MAEAKFLDNFGTLSAFAWTWTTKNPNNWNIVAACLIFQENEKIHHF